MADTEEQAGTTTNKHDDFFDEPPRQNVVLTPEPPKENGEVESETPKQNGDVTPVPQETTDTTNDEGGTVDTTNDEGGTAGTTNDEGGTVGDQENLAKEDDHNEVTANGDADVQAEAEPERNETPAEDAAEEDKVNGVQQINGEELEEDGFTSNPSTPVVEQSQEVDGNAADNENVNEEKPCPVEKGEAEPTVEPRNEEESPTADVGSQEKEGEDTQHGPSEQEERRTPSGGEDNYDDSFADDTSLQNADEGETVTVVVDAPASAIDEIEKQEEGDTEEPGTDPQQRLVSPSPSDSRAEAGAVVPVVSETDDTKVINDGRSSATADEQGELFRGEDRKEEPAPEGSEDCRGQGQWKSAEQQYIASAILVEKSDKEALDEAVKEKEKLHDEYSEAKIKDLQERLAILARENEQKDKQIGKLEQNLVDVTEKLRETERKLFATEKSSQHQEAPKSKTCTIM